ncbi:Enoyl-CoA hydratase [Hyphomicrobiales bacterium]|jgi:DSF synthase|nr:Enoyl-CoA hydratase [Hyphomicrobiales bacterium]CAH1702879.1 Enoyl-CoA hydratase/isomerase family protein [Hyphomicrobiales bacterium]CAI0347066.1 DSF synthase [Hyphomicrobiales bacterium]
MELVENIPARTFGLPHIATGGPASLARRLDEICREFTAFRMRFDETTGVLWATMLDNPFPSFAPAMLQEMRLATTAVRVAAEEGQAQGLEFCVLHSETPGVFSLGGDLSTFARAIREGDAPALRRYARHSCDLVYDMWSSFDLPVTTVAFVAGTALGGGFEAARACNVVVAERGTRLGLPEVKFGLFAAIGAISLLTRHVPWTVVQRLMIGGEIMPAEELHALGVVDVLLEPGAGIDGFLRYLNTDLRRERATRSLVQSARRRVAPLPIGELYDVADQWIEAAMALTPEDVRRMERINAAQRRHLKRA